jgi:hypothetical protein
MMPLSKLITTIPTTATMGPPNPNQVRRGEIEAEEAGEAAVERIRGEDPQA